jgi:hypothetical protein
MLGGEVNKTESNSGFGRAKGQLSRIFVGEIFDLRASLFIRENFGSAVALIGIQRFLLLFVI